MKPPHLLLGLATPLVVVVLLAAAAEAVVRYQPATPTPAPEAFVSVVADERTFTLFAALNAAGYADENFGEPMHPVRVTVREHLAARRLPDLTRLRAQLGFMHPFAFVEWVLHYGQPPTWPRTVAGWDGSAPAMLFFGMDSDLREFHRAAEIGALWRNVQPDYAAEAERYRAAAAPAIAQVLAYTRSEVSPVGHIVVIPNLLDAHWRGYGPHIGGTAYVVVGPTRDKPDTGLVQHEVLHSLLGPLIETHHGVITSAQAERLFTRLRSEVNAQSYGTWPAILEESVINAVGVRLAEPEWRATALHNDEARGFWLTRPLAEKLVEYERGSTTLADFLPELLQSLNQLDVDGLASGVEAPTGAPASDH